MKVLITCTVIIFYLVSMKITAITSDLPCAARPVTNRSVVCVCNRTYCDEITRDAPEEGAFVTYTTSKNGSRFKKGFGYLQTIDDCLSNSSSKLSLVLNPEKRYQTIKGFGGAVTDSAGIVWKSLPVELQKYLINSYVGDTGIEYNMVRLPIGSTDFSTRVYTLDDSPGDDQLKNFSLQYEDYEYKIPMIKELMNVSNTKIYVIGSYWSSPRWMKLIIEQNPVCGFLKYQYYQTFADYLLKFVDSYEAEAIPIWALTTGNEPSIDSLPDPPGNCLSWATKDLGNWIVKNLGPTVRNSTYGHLKILAMDDQRYSIKVVFEPMVSDNPDVLDNIDGVAVHYYADAYVSSYVLAEVSERYSKFVISTEASIGFRSERNTVDLGSWERAKKYAKDIIEDLNNDVVGWVDWNICLNTGGGPNVERNFVDSPIIADADNEEFLKQPMFYIIGQFSKFIPRDSQRIDIKAPKCEEDIHHVAFLTPSNTIVVVICNQGTARPVSLQIRNEEVVIDLEEDSIVTVEFQNE